MPYVSLTERERAEWMTLPEAITHVVSTDSCTETEARRQIQEALNDGELRLPRWADRAEPPGSPRMSRMQMPDDRTPQAGEWKAARIDWDAGTVLNEVSEYRPGEWRVLWLSRVTVVSIWRPATEAKAEPPNPADNEVIKKSSKLKKIQSHIAATYPNGIPAGVTDKMIANATGTSERHVRRARRQ
ncbi:MAG: hypothetical protein ACREE4_00275 [Stellaceae bacterium]